MSCSTICKKWIHYSAD